MNYGTFNKFDDASVSVLRYFCRSSIFVFSLTDRQMIQTRNNTCKLATTQRYVISMFQNNFRAEDHLTSVEYTALHRPIYVLDNLFREGRSRRWNLEYYTIILPNSNTYCDFRLFPACSIFNT